MPGIVTGIFDYFKAGALSIENMGLLFFSAGSPIYAQVDNFSQIFAAFGLHLLGLIISFIVSFDLLEGLSQILGAPSLNSRVMQKVI